MTNMAQRCGSTERCCRFHFKMRIWCFCRLLLSIKLLKCFGNNNNKNPVKYISRCFYGKFPRQLLTEKKKIQAAEQPSYSKSTEKPSETERRTACQVCAAPACGRAGWGWGASSHSTFLLTQCFFMHRKYISIMQLKIQRGRGKGKPQGDGPQGVGPCAM